MACLLFLTMSVLALPCCSNDPKRAPECQNTHPVVYAELCPDSPEDCVDITSPQASRFLGTPSLLRASLSCLPEGAEGLRLSVNETSVTCDDDLLCEATMGPEFLLAETATVEVSTHDADSETLLLSTRVPLLRCGQLAAEERVCVAFDDWVELPDPIPPTQSSSEPGYLNSFDISRDAHGNVLLLAKHLIAEHDDAADEWIHTLYRYEAGSWVNVATANGELFYEELIIDESHAEVGGYDSEGGLVLDRLAEGDDSAALLLTRQELKSCTFPWTNYGDDSSGSGGGQAFPGTRDFENVHAAIIDGVHHIFAETEQEVAYVTDRSGEWTCEAFLTTYGYETGFLTDTRYTYSMAHTVSDLVSLSDGSLHVFIRSFDTIEAVLSPGEEWQLRWVDSAQLLEPYEPSPLVEVVGVRLVGGADGTVRGFKPTQALRQYTTVCDEAEEPFEPDPKFLFRYQRLSEGRLIASEEIFYVAQPILDALASNEDLPEGFWNVPAFASSVHFLQTLANTTDPCGRSHALITTSPPPNEEFCGVGKRLSIPVAYITNLHGDWETQLLPLPAPDRLLINKSAPALLLDANGDLHLLIDTWAIDPEDPAPHRLHHWTRPCLEYLDTSKRGKGI